MYMQALLIHRGSDPGLTRPRERNMRNLLASLPDVGPGVIPAAVLDKSQIITHCALRVDGDVGTMATSEEMWCMADGNVMTLAEMAKLMGHDVSTMNLEGISDPQFREMLGMSIHRAVAGFLCTGLIAALAL